MSDAECFVGRSSPQSYYAALLSGGASLRRDTSYTTDRKESVESSVLKEDSGLAFLYFFHVVLDTVESSPKSVVF